MAGFSDLDTNIFAKIVGNPVLTVKDKLRLAATSKETHRMVDDYVIYEQHKDPIMAQAFKRRYQDETIQKISESIPHFREIVQANHVPFGKILMRLSHAKNLPPEIFDHIIADFLFTRLVQVPERKTAVTLRELALNPRTSVALRDHLSKLIKANDNDEMLAIYAKSATTTEELNELVAICKKPKEVELIQTVGPALRLAALHPNASIWALRRISNNSLSDDVTVAVALKRLRKLACNETV